MKKFLLLLFLIPNLVMAKNNTCEFIVRSEQDFYNSKVRITENCGTGYILIYMVKKKTLKRSGKHLNPHRVDEFVTTVKSMFCDYDKQISSINNESSYGFTCQVK